MTQAPNNGNKPTFNGKQFLNSLSQTASDIRNENHMYRGVAIGAPQSQHQHQAVFPFGNPFPLKENTRSMPVMPGPNPFNMGKPMMKPSGISMQSQMVVEAPCWTGPLSPFNTFRSNISCVEMVSSLNVILETMVETEKVDFDCTQYQINGRMYKNNDISEFQLTVYKAEESNEEDYSSLLEIRRTSGDSFVHDAFFQHVTNVLKKEKKILANNEMEEEDSIEFNVFDSSSFKLESDFDLSEFDLEDTESEVSELDDQSIPPTQSNEEWILELIGVLKDEESFRDMWRHAATQLAEQVTDTSNQKNTKTLELLMKDGQIISGIFEPIYSCSKLKIYDCLIIRSVLKIILALLEQNENISIPKSLKTSLVSLKSDWHNGPQRQLGELTMHFTKSQQIERLCEKCIEHLE